MQGALHWQWSKIFVGSLLQVSCLGKPHDDVDVDGGGGDDDDEALTMLSNTSVAQRSNSAQSILGGLNGFLLGSLNYLFDCHRKECEKNICIINHRENSFSLSQHSHPILY